MNITIKKPALNIHDLVTKGNILVHVNGHSFKTVLNSLIKQLGKDDEFVTYTKYRRTCYSKVGYRFDGHSHIPTRVMVDGLSYNITYGSDDLGINSAIISI